MKTDSQKLSTEDLHIVPDPEPPTTIPPDPPPNPQQLAALQRADQALRCSHIKVDGVRCGSPALRGDVFCYFHARHFYYRQYENQFQPLEDGNAIQLAIMQVISELRYNRIDYRTAKVLLYGLQTASVNLPHIKYDPPAESLSATPEYGHLAASHPSRSSPVNQGSGRSSSQRNPGATTPTLSADPSGMPE